MLLECPLWPNTSDFSTGGFYLRYVTRSTYQSTIYLLPQSSFCVPNRKENSFWHSSTDYWDQKKPPSQVEEWTMKGLFHSTLEPHSIATFNGLPMFCY